MGDVDQASPAPPTALASFGTILIFGGTSGIGESFTRRFHALGKKVIITGRRKGRLATLAQELPGVETYLLDNNDLTHLPTHIDHLLKKYPSIDTVWVNSGVSNVTDFTKLNSQTDNEAIMAEITVNLTAPIVIARHAVPFLLAAGRKSHFIVTGSGLGFLPVGRMSTYSATKAAVHSFMAGLRDSVSGTCLGVIELAVPHVRTDFSTGVPGGMELEDFTRQMFEILQTTASDELREVGLAFGKVAAEVWRKAFDLILAARGSKG